MGNGIDAKVGGFLASIFGMVIMLLIISAVDIPNKEILYAVTIIAFSILGAGSLLAISEFRSGSGRV